MLRWLMALRRARGELLSAAYDKLAQTGSPLERHEAEYLVRTAVNAYLVALTQGDAEHLAESMALLAEREARAGNALRVEAVVVGLDLLAQQVRELADDGRPTGSLDPLALLDLGRERFVSVYLRAKATEDERRARALESYAEAAEEMPHIVYSTDADGRITDINHLAAELLGYRKEDLLGRHHSVLMRPEDAVRYRHFVQERRTEARATRRERVLLRTAEGAVREFEVSSTGVYGADGVYLGSDGLARAVSGEVLQLEYQLDPDGRFQAISDAAAAALGYLADELLGQHFSALMDERERERVGHMFGERRADDRAASGIRVVLTGRDGARREFEISAAGRYDAGGQFVGTVGLGSDLSERSELERDVAESRRRYHAVFDHVGVGLSVITPDHTVREANAWHHRRRRRPVAGGQCYLGLYGESEPCEWCGLREALSTGQAVVRDSVVSALDGRSYTVVFTPLLSRGGETIAVIEVTLDATSEHERRERELAGDKHGALQRLCAGLCERAGGALTAAALLAAMVPAGDAMGEAVGAVTQALAPLARLGGHRLPVPGAGLDLNAAVRAALASVALSDGVDLETDLLPTLPPVALAAADAEELVAQLLVNAREAMPTGGTLTVETGLDREGQVVLRVSDTGEGMSETVARQARDPFFTTRGAERVGLGLAQVEALARAADGSLELHTMPGLGTQVELRVPARQPVRARDTAAKAAAGRPAVRVAVADPLLQRALEQYLAASPTSPDGPPVWVVDPANRPRAGGARGVVVLATAAADEPSPQPEVYLALPFGVAALEQAIAEVSV